MKLTRYEQETIINFNAHDQMATLYTRDPAVTYRKPRRLSEEQREAARKRIMKLNNS